MLYICGIVQCIKISSESQHARIPDYKTRRRKLYHRIR
jgi:hypothetical protein